eukprot:TRINITY_DN6870_c0_g1_i1.p1 TRINITY_DN6870_c0_g1~~TRINITY_DN6870_c0_g1_i1.p1  ORF type:complete len:285 (-),score=17.01 TRINITY_DN6870_c0_g1_i1:7-771(-)
MEEQVGETNAPITYDFKYLEVLQTKLSQTFRLLNEDSSTGLDFDHTVCLDFSLYPKFSRVGTAPKNRLPANFLLLLCSAFPVFEKAFLHSEIYERVRLHFRTPEEVNAIWGSFNKFILGKAIIALSTPEGIRFFVSVTRVKKKIEGSKVIINNIPPKFASLPDHEFIEFITKRFIDPCESRDNNRVLDIDRFIPGTSILSSRVFVTFAHPPICFLHMVRIAPRSGRETRFVVPKPPPRGSSMSYKWCYVARTLR